MGLLVEDFLQNFVLSAFINGGDGHVGGVDWWKDERRTVAAWIISGLVLARFSDTWRVVRAKRWVVLFWGHLH